MKLYWEKLKQFKDKITLISSLLLMVSGVGLFSGLKFITDYFKSANYAIINYSNLSDKVTKIEIDINNINDRLNNYDEIENNVSYLISDSEILSGLLSANMKKINNNNQYFVIIDVFDDKLNQTTKKTVLVKLRIALGSGDLYVFVPYGEINEAPIIKKFSAKWHEDEDKYYYIDENGKYILIYELNNKQSILDFDL